MRRAALLLALLLCLAALTGEAGPAQAASPKCEAMRGMLVRGGGSASGLVVYEEGRGTICTRAPNRPRSLASNMKLFTTATALARLGPQHRIPTRLYTDGWVGLDGVLHGSLYLQGGGDPALGSPAFYGRYLGGLGTNLFALKTQVRAAGIERVTGRLYADDTVFDRLRGVADSGYGTSPYIGPLSGLPFNLGYRDARASGFASDPARTGAAALARSLRGAGIALRAGIALSPTPSDPTLLAAVRSPTIERLAEATNVPSNNFYAETLIKLLGARLGGAGTTAAGAAVVERFARSLGTSVQAVDGSGLTRANRARPWDVVRLLASMHGGEVADEFIQGLPSTGLEGTVADRMEGTAAYGRCRTKTGTLTGVSALSGYCFNRSGRVMIFSILMASVYDLGLAHREQDRIAALVASY
ncbi:MAG TPA: D-alanyl-D-alanine carboxypeptidase [Solirubrobacterales bacterium]|nr:D-alanyl-D-alanine carboxypeptidase [Solirubrobacterales bacterium]